MIFASGRKPDSRSIDPLTTLNASQLSTAIAKSMSGLARLTGKALLFKYLNNRL